MSLRPDPDAFVKLADLWARAMLAAAWAYDDGPVEVLTDSRRRLLVRQAACLGIVQASGLSIGEVATRLGLQPSAVRRMKTEGDREFEAAVRAAARAVEYACWRPEAAESVVQGAPVAGGADLDDEAEPAAESLPAPPAPKPRPVRRARTQAPLPAPEPKPVRQARTHAPLPEPEPKPAPMAPPHAPLAGRVNLANGHAFTPAFRPGPPPPTQSLEARILARLGQAPTCPRSLASILGVKESFVDQSLRVLGLEGRVIAADTPAGASPRETLWSLA